MAGTGSGVLIKWRESSFRSEAESESEKLTQKNVRNPEFRGIPADFPTKVDGEI
jgi:hypothetical protein